MNYSEKKYKSTGSGSPAGPSGRDSVSGQKMYLGRRDNMLILLIAICLIMFVGLAFMKAVWYYRYPKEEALAFFNKDILSLFILPADPGKMIDRPWTIITHMFVHDNVWKIFANMLWLWCFGYILQDLSGNKKIIPVFVYGSLGGAIAFILAYNFLPSLTAQMPFANVLGASAGVMALAIATTLTSPGYRIFPLIGGGIPLWGFTAFYIISDLTSISFSDTAYLIAPVAGAVTGFLFVFFLRRGFDWGRWMNNFFDWVNNLFNPDKPGKGKNSKDELFYKSSMASFTKNPNLTQQRIDEILDKIYLQGYDHLSDEEKEILERAGEEEL